MPRSISPTSRTLTGVASIPSEGAADWMALNYPMPEAGPAKLEYAPRACARVMGSYGEEISAGERPTLSRAYWLQKSGRWAKRLACRTDKRRSKNDG